MFPNCPPLGRSHAAGGISFAGAGRHSGAGRSVGEHQTGRVGAASGTGQSAQAVHLAHRIDRRGERRFDGVRGGLEDAQFFRIAGAGGQRRADFPSGNVGPLRAVGRRLRGCGRLDPQPGIDDHASGRKSLNSNGAESSELAWSYSGGGVSEYFARPSWQTGTGMPSGTMRAVPDVACPADPNNGAVLFYNGAQAVIGGTSWSSPTWAGYCALINQARSNAGLSQIGLLGPKIYPLIGSTNFRDITSGSNSVGANSGGKYSAGTGYDPVTGIGVPLMQALTQTLVGSPSDTPTMPQSGLIAMALLLIWVVIRQRARLA